jgi:cytochrome c oxidase subunit 2
MLRWLPENVSTFGGQIDHIFYVIYYLTAAVFLFVAVLTVSFLFMYRGKEGRKAVYSHGNTALEITWTAIPALILVVLAFMSLSTWSEVKIYKPPADVEVKVLGKQFNWEVHYPGADGKLDTADDFSIDNELHVPVNKVVHVRLSSKDVIHSFFVPNFRLKQDAVPGREIIVWFEATRTGKYELPCAELCGFGHSGMVGWVYVQTPEDYAKFLEQTVKKS